MEFVYKVFVLCFFIGASYQQAPSYFVPYGPGQGDTELPRNDDIPSGEVPFTHPVVFWGTTYSSCYVSTNGFITLGSASGSFTPTALSNLATPAVVVYWGDVDTRPANGGYIYYRATANTQQLNDVSTFIRASQGNNFQGTGMFVTTWYQVGYYPQRTDKLDTFQAVIIADDNQNTYGLLNYGTIQWYTGGGASAGFTAGDGVRWAQISGSLTPDILNIASGTNVYINGVPQTGQYLYQISQGVVINDDTASSTLVNVVFLILGCNSNADCNVHGVCIESYQGKGCSCLSGFGGDFCDTRPASCAYNPVFSNVTNFDPAVSFSVASSQISFAVTAALEQTQYVTPNLNDNPTSATAYALETSVRFGSSFTPCDYPPTLASRPWTHNSADGSCIDQWGLSVPWSYAVSSCGFSDSDHDHTWTQTVTVGRKYQLPNLGVGVPATRTESISNVLQVVFPTSVMVQTDVNVTGPIAVSANALVSNSYNPGDDTWTVLVKTLTNRPYKLSDPVVTSITGDIATNHRYVKVLIADNTACNSNAESCAQTISLTFASCYALSGNLVIQTTPVCSGTTDGGIGATCPSITGYVSIGISINNADSCGTVNEIDFSLKTLSSFADSALTIPKTQFAASDIAYFGANIQSSNATISGLTLTSACMSLSGGPCTTIAVTPLANAGGLSPVFAVNLAQTRFFTTDTSLQTFTVKATVSVTWANGKRDTVQTARANIQSSVAIDLTEEKATIIEEESEANVMKASIAIVFALFMLFVM